VYFPAQRAITFDGSNVAQWIPPPRHPHSPRSTWARVRALDGVHLCDPGTELYAAAIAADVATLAHRPVSPRRWWLDGWQNVKTLYWQRVNSYCPTDHPG